MIRFLTFYIFVSLITFQFSFASTKAVNTPKLPAIASFTAGAWIPYWREASGTEEVVKNISKLSIISPFAYEVDNNGKLIDKMKLHIGPYAELIKEAKNKKKLIVPTVLWYPTDEKSRDALDAVLRNDKQRAVLISAILSEVKKHNVDGIDIDFENKKAETREVFSLFLDEISTALHKNNKLLICTVEARTPSDTDFVNGPSKEKDAIRSNDYKRIGKACDQVRIMAYDQGTANNSAVNIKDTSPYRPVADIDWVKKVLTLAMRDIPWKKIIVGVPTYGYKYEITRDDKSNIISYKSLGSMNYLYANEEAINRNIKPIRHKSGELYYTYIDTNTNKEYLIWYSDAISIKQKVELAKLYKLGGVVIFKIDGQNDKDVWKNI